MSTCAYSWQNSGKHMVKRKRKDVSSSNQEEATSSKEASHVIKCSLAGLLFLDDGTNAFRAELEKFVENVSKSVNKGSLLLNRFLIRKLSNGGTLPNLKNQTLYFQCLDIGSGRCYKPIDGLQEVWDECFGNFPNIEKLPGNGQALNYAAKTFQTNFLNSLWCPFYVRQGYLLKAYCQENDLDKKASHPIKCAINGWNCNAPVPDEAVAFVEQQRELLGLVGEDQVTEIWLKENPERVLRFYWATLSYLERITEENWRETEKIPRVFSLSPVSAIKRHFVTLDRTVLYNLLRNSALIPKTMKKFEFNDLAGDDFGGIFRIKKLAGKKKIFSNMIQTDGVSACVHFTCSERTLCEETSSSSDAHPPWTRRGVSPNRVR